MNDKADDDVDRQISALTEIVGTLAASISHLQARVDTLGSTAGAGGHDDSDQKTPEPAAWVWFAPPAAAQDEPGACDPQFTVDQFVAWYNITYVGTDGSRAKPIPACWRQHPGLAMEVATLAYSWRAANLGPSASVREAQYWHHQSRPGFTDRMTREWTHPDCLDGDHRPTGATVRPDRFTLGDQ